MKDYGTSVISNGCVCHMQACNHEEADTRMLIHLLDAVTNGATTCLIRTVDTDVIVILIGKLHVLLKQQPACDIYMHGWRLEQEKTSDMSI